MTKITVRDKRGNTPLHIAARDGYSETVHTLIKRGANVNAANNDGDTPLRVVKKTGGSKAIRALLIDFGATL